MVRFRRRPAEEPTDETLVIDDRPRVEGEVVEEEVDPGPRPPTIWPWLLALALLVVAGGVAYWLLTRDEDKTTMPRVVGLTEAQARTRVAEAELEPEVRRGRSERKAGIVFAQTPGAGTQLEEGQRVVIHVSSGRKLVSVPAVRDLDEDEAIRRLQDAGFKTTVQRVFAGAPKGQVVEQTPRGGTEAPQGSTVELKVSKGRNLSKVPDVVGEQESEAVRILREREFEPRIFDVPSEEPKGTVVSQAPAGGEQAPPDSRVRINVSTGETTGEEAERSATTGGGTTTAPAGSAAPRVVGLAQTPALRRLENAGYRGIVAYRTSDEPAGRVIEQSPLSGQRVRVVVSAGRNTVPTEVPDVRGEELDSATQTLEDAGFRVETIEVGNGTTVQDQQPRPNVTSYEGAVVTLFVG
jgi:beta-lactam-binding protein with PASTA domain